MPILSCGFSFCLMNQPRGVINLIIMENITTTTTKTTAAVAEKNQEKIASK